MALTRLVRTLALTAVAVSFACSSEEAAVVPTDITGSWRAVLASPGGELPFTVEIRKAGTGSDGYDGFDTYEGFVHNASEALPFSDVTFDGEQLRLVFAWYDSRIEAQYDPATDSLSGEWSKTIPDGTSQLNFSAARGESERFRAATDTGVETGDPAALTAVTGVWDVVFSDEDGTEPARGEFDQNGARVSGTFLTPTGDYRFLEGSFEDGLLRLSTFDGGHAFLFHGRAQPDGSLEGDFWSRDTYHATWTAQPGTPEATTVPDAWELVGLNNDEGRLDFSFPDLNGTPVSLGDPQFEDKVVLVNIFGSWCPNCNDEAPLLADWSRLYRDRGLEVVGLAYEFTGDADRDRSMVQRFKVRHRIEYPLLLAGTSDKQAAAETLPDLSSVVAYPTTVFVDRSGTVRKIHSGFSGPGTGEHYDALVAEMVGLIEELLAEPAS